MDKQLIKTNNLGSFNYDFNIEYNSFRLSKITNDKFEEIKNKKEIFSYIKISGGSDIGEYIFLSKKDFDFKKELRNGVKDFDLKNIKDYQKYNLLLRLLPSLKGSKYFLNSNNNCSIIIKKETSIISALEFVITTEGYLKLNLNTYEIKEKVIESFGKNESEIKKAKKRKPFIFDESINILKEDKKGIWIQKRSYNAKKGSVSVIDSGEENDMSKMEEIFKLNNYLKENNFQKLELQDEFFSIYKKTGKWNEKKDVYKNDILLFLKDIKIEVVNESEDENAKELLEKEIKEAYVKYKNNNKINIGAKIGKSDFKIIIVSDKELLRKLKKEDNYNSIKERYPYSQIISQSNIKKDMNDIILNSIKELIIKDNIKNNKINFLSNEKDFVYYALEEKNFLEEVEFVTVMNVKKNKINFEVISDSELQSHIENITNSPIDKNLSFFDNVLMKGILVVNNKIYVIERTEKAVYPDIEKFFIYKNDLKLKKNKEIKKEKIDELLINYNKKLLITKQKIRNKETNNLIKEQNKLISIISDINEIKNIFKNRKHSFKDLENFLRKNKKRNTKIIKNSLENLCDINPSFRKETDLENHLFKNFISIWYNNNEYYTGDSNTANSSYKKLNYIYKVSENIIDNEFISFIDNVFVKHLGLANLPFPDKYIKEYNKIVLSKNKMIYEN